MRRRREKADRKHRQEHSGKLLDLKGYGKFPKQKVKILVKTEIPGGRLKLPPGRKQRKRGEA